MRNPLRTLVIVLLVLLALVVLLSFLSHERPVGPMEEDVTNELVGSGAAGG